MELACLIIYRCVSGMIMLGSSVNNLFLPMLLSLFFGQCSRKTGWGLKSYTFCKKNHVILLETAKKW